MEDCEPKEQPQDGLQHPNHTANLRLVLAAYFNERELRPLCRGLGISYDSLPGEGKVNKINELITFCASHERISQLVDTIKQLRPNASWEVETEAIGGPSATLQDHLHEHLTSAKTTFTQADINKLTQLLDYCFSEEELKALCFDLAVDYELLAGTRKDQKATALVAYFARSERGIHELVKICTTLRPKAPWNTPGTVKYEPYNPDMLVELRQKLVEYFGEGQVRGLCRSLDVDYEDLPATYHISKAEELVSYLARRERIEELIALCSQQYSNVAWRHTTSESE